MNRAIAFILLLLLAVRTNANVFFDGTNDFIDLGSSALGSPLKSGTGDFTWMGWLQVSSVGTTDSLLIESNDGTAERSLAIGASKISFFVRGSNGQSVTLVGATTLIVGRWYHVAGTRSSGTLVAYLNGVSDGTGTNGALGNTDISGTSVKIGGRNVGSSTFLGGFIDDVRIYNRALSASEIQSIGFSRSRIQGTDGLIGYWPMDDGVDGQVNGTVLDRAGNGNTGTLTNGAIFKGSDWINYP